MVKVSWILIGKYKENATLPVSWELKWAVFFVKI